MNKVICFGRGHFARDCTHTPARPGNRPVENHSISTRRWNLVVASLPVTSRPSERRSQATTSIDAQTQTASTLPTTSVLKWCNEDHNTPGE
jgi:hypothetical protein